jgi:hypothetical protein
MKSDDPSAGGTASWLLRKVDVQQDVNLYRDWNDPVKIAAKLTTYVGRHRLRDRGDDLYETPAPATLALCRSERLPLRIWEPAAGRGAIVKVLRNAGHEVAASDLVHYGMPGQAAGIDFLLEQSAPAGVEAIVTNPPYKAAAEFVRHGLDLAPQVYLLLRIQFLAAKRRNDIISRRLRAVHVFGNRLPMMHRDGWDGPRASSAHDHAWFCWDSNQTGPATVDQILWVRP